MASVISILAFFCAALTNWVAVATNRRWLEWLSKPAALVALLLFAATGENTSALLLAALGCSLLGDVYLMLPGDLFGAGLGAFLLGHVAYIGAFGATLSGRVAWLGILAIVSYPVTARIVRSVTDVRLRSAVLTYIAIILTMAGSAIAHGNFWGAAGAILFLGSDGVLAWDRFVQPLAWARPAVMVTYHLGQLGLVLALR